MVETFVNFINDIWDFPQIRQATEEVRVLSQRQCGHVGREEMPMGSRRVLDSLRECKCILQSALLDPHPAPATEFQLRWGHAAEPPAPISAPAAPPLLAPAPQALPAVQIRLAHDRQPEEASGAVIESALYLCDWLERAAMETNLPPAKVIEIALERGRRLLEALHLERIDRVGILDRRDQQIVDTVAAECPDLDLTVAETVECGYRCGERIIRPQKVIAYRHQRQGL